MSEPDTAVDAVVSPRQAEADQDELTLALSGLSQLALGAGSLSPLLVQIAVFAVQAIPGADGASLTMLEPGRSELVAASAQFVRAVDDVQYGIDEGPCITAAREARTVIAGALGTDPTWPRFGPQAHRLGVNSAVSLPLTFADEVLGALNVYAHDIDVFDDHAARLGHIFAIPAAIAVHNARLLSQAQRESMQLQQAMTNRATIDQAIGILRSRNGSSEDEAFATLRSLSQNQNTKLSAIAHTIVDEAVRRARARRARSHEA